jgi:hypothetical protein
MIVTRCVIRFTTHAAHVQVDHRGVVQVFKYGARSCDFDVFEESDQVAASDYILTPPADTHYYVSFPDEIPPNLQS